MQWLRARARGGAVPPSREARRAGSKGSDRDPADVALEGVADAAIPAGGAGATSDDVQAWRGSPEQAAGKPHPQAPGADAEDGSSPASSPGPGAVHDVDREELASRLFDSIDRSGDGLISKDELTPALQVAAPGLCRCLAPHRARFMQMHAGASKRRQGVCNGMPDACAGIEVCARGCTCTDAASCRCAL